MPEHSTELFAHVVMPDGKYLNFILISDMYNLQVYTYTCRSVGMLYCINFTKKHSTNFANEILDVILYVYNILTHEPMHKTLKSRLCD